MSNYAANNLVLYKSKPARVVTVDDKIEIELEEGKNKRVRDKDLLLLHPGPLKKLEDLAMQTANVEEAWELLQGETATLEELTSLVFGEFSPNTAWSSWQIVEEGLFFKGTPDELIAIDEETMAAEKAQRDAKAAEKADWESLVERLKMGLMEEKDRKSLAEVERVALARNNVSRIMAEVGIDLSPVNAHRFLCQIGYWPSRFNPYPLRLGLDTTNPDLPVPELQEEQRRDLTEMDSWAIDDIGNTDPDDAIALVGDKVWVHIADVAALVKPDSELDLLAKGRAANQYLPDKTVNMLPSQITEILGMGLTEISPALSIGFVVDDEGMLSDIDICISQVKVKRTTYEDVSEQIDSDDFRDLYELTQRFRRRRFNNGAATLDLPEVNVRVDDSGNISIQPMQKLSSRDMVTDAMLMAGEAVTLFCADNDIAIPYATQNPPETDMEAHSLSEMYAYRRFFKASRSTTVADTHAGLGLNSYTRATSPLRRYLDLVVHQQLRAFLKNEPLLTLADVTERIGASDTMTRSIRRSERLSNTHWKLIKLKQEIDTWTDTAVVVEIDDQRITLMIPSLAMESKMRLQRPLKLDQIVDVSISRIDIADQMLRLRVKS